MELQQPPSMLAGRNSTFWMTEHEKEAILIATDCTELPSCQLLTSGLFHMKEYTMLCLILLCFDAY